MAYIQKDSEPTAIPGSILYGSDPDGGFSLVPRACVDAGGDKAKTRWCANPPNGGELCELDCPVRGRTMVLTKR